MNFRKRFLVGDKKFRLADADPSDTFGIEETDALARAEANKQKLAKLQTKLYASRTDALLIVLQGMDAAGKDGTISHVMTGINPQGVDVTSFKQPDTRERAHDFLWRVHAAVPPLGMIGIFNRSHYEDVLIVRVHKLVPDEVWQARYQQIRDFERLLTAARTHVVKFCLHISKEEQGRRLEARLKDPDKNWKAADGDFVERKLWGSYQKAYQDALVECSRKAAPWYVIPADHKWFRDLAVSQIVVDTLEDLNLKYPEPHTSGPAPAA